MQLSEILYQYTNDTLKQLAGLCGCTRATRKDDLAHCIQKTLLMPASLAFLWRQLDPLSRKAVAAAYYNDGEFNPIAFVAQYGSLPERPPSKWSWDIKPIPLDLFLYAPHTHFTNTVNISILPSDLMPLLEYLVPPPDKFQVNGQPERPKTVLGRYRKEVELICTETEQTGLHDLVAYLRLINEGKISADASGRATLAGIKQILGSLLQEDFFPLPAEGKIRANQIIRPFGLDVFAHGSGLVRTNMYRGNSRLTAIGQKFYQTQDINILLEAFETWTREGWFDELSRISGLKGQKSRNSLLTPPASRREAVIEALSWCPVGVWIDLEDFYRAVKIWHFDFAVEKTVYSSLYVGNKDYGTLYGESYWPVVKGSYIKVILWEYLGSIGALDLLYTRPEETASQVNLPYSAEILSLYDGLRYFRINPLGAFLLGQAHEYVSSKPLHPSLFTISGDFMMTITSPAELTPNDHSYLEQLATPAGNHRYRLDTQRLLTSLEEGQTLDYLTDFLKKHHVGPLPPEVLAWLDGIKEKTQAFKKGDAALFIKTKSADLADLIINDPLLQKYCTLVDKKTVVIPASREKALRARLKELEYLLQ